MVRSPIRFTDWRSVERHAGIPWRSSATDYTLSGDRGRNTMNGREIWPLLRHSGTPAALAGISSRDDDARARPAPFLATDSGSAGLAAIGASWERRPSERQGTRSWA